MADLSHPGSRVLVAILVVCAWLMHAPARADAVCQFDGTDINLLESEPVRVGWLSSPAKITVGEPFELRVQVCPADASLRAVDAQMPLHRHGMNYRPSIHPMGKGRWQVQGMVWHMSGLWQLEFSVALPSSGHSASVELRQDVMLR